MQLNIDQLIKCTVINKSNKFGKQEFPGGKSGSQGSLILNLRIKMINFAVTIVRLNVSFTVALNEIKGRVMICMNVLLIIHRNLY